MILLAFVIAAIATVPLAGGSPGRLLDVRIRVPGLAVAALALQVLIVSLEGDPTLQDAIHIGSYLLVFAFLLANRGLPWMWVIFCGAALNFAAIAANGGVMPASRWALRTAGLPADEEGFHSGRSGALEDPNLLFLGDVLPVPEAAPLSSVFSIGDLLIGVGALLAIHRICGSRLGGASRAADREPGRV